MKSLAPPSSIRLAAAILWGLVAALAVVSVVWALGADQFGPSPSGVGGVVLLVGAALLVAWPLYLLATSPTVRAMARHTFVACLRTKVAAVFIVLLAVALAVLPAIMRGDGTLTGKVQTFLAYGTGITSMLLSLVTIFLATGVIATDVRTKQIFSVTTKPVGRWQYVLGRWLGLVALNVVLLSAAAVVLYGLARYLEGGKPLNPEDRRRLETEVFTARKKVGPVPIDVEGRMTKRLKELKRDRRGFEGALAAIREKHKLKTEQEALDKLKDQIRQQILDRLQSRPPTALNRPARPLQWRFEGIDVAGKQRRAAATVVKMSREDRAFAFRIDQRLASRLVYRGPVKVNGIEGRVIGLKVDAFAARFSVEGMNQPGVGRLKVGDRVEVVVDPVIQLTYQASAAGEVPDRQLHCAWVIRNPSTGARYYERRTTPIKTPVTITPPARVVDRSGRCVAEYFNLVNPRTGTGTKVTILEKDIAVLYRVGGFEGNFLRGILLILLQLMFLSAVGVFAASFASFPVACLVCFVLLPFSMARGFLADATKLPTASRTWEVAWYEWVGHYVFRFMVMLLPDFERTSPAHRLVDGAYISWANVAAAAMVAVAFRALIALGAACLIFRKRELARVQV